ncbi:MAG: 50S ribosomal protein L16 [Oligoflexales bacterium]|nr:50S ribosomal protein L16 [Oligoflexales bacterium]
MLAPKKTKFRKQHKGRIKGMATSGNELAFGEYGLMALEPGKITAKQIEAARIAMTRQTKRGGQVWIKIFPDTPVTKKPAEVRMGSGKGAVDHYAAKVRPGRILYEIGGIDKAVAVSALELAAAKLPIKTKLLSKNEDPWIA